MRAVGGGIEHMAVDGIASLKDINLFGRAPTAPTASAFAADVQNEQQDRRGGADHTQRQVLAGK
ncbi:MAG: Potassium channel Kv1.4 tandem inactivation domain [Rhodobacteraceae bacterium HLUCCA08]|nr:MAG: Potassium channel Kv1.4 tandem inactivation domain [Rhodobacteraceae bacterium HLUCCA08]